MEGSPPVTWHRVLAVLSCLAPLAAAAQTDPVQVTFLNVGQGDAILIRAPEGQTALIDAGPGVDLSAALARWGVDTLDLVIASHPHADHIGGMQQVLERTPVRFYMDNGQAHTTTTYMVVMQELQRRTDITYLEAVPRTLQLGSVTIRILPLPAYSGSNLNNRSVGVVVEYGEFRAFLSGDSERPELQHFMQVGAVPDVTLLKAPHHGSDDAVSDRFLSIARPELVVISVGLGNRYGHPRASALYAYNKYAEHVLRTDLQGEITVSGFTDGTYSVTLGDDVVAEGQERAAETERPTPTPGAPGSLTDEAAAISISVFADAPGNDHQNLNGEYAVLDNRTSQPLDLSGWTLCDAARHCFTFPEAAELTAMGQVVLYTGRGLSDGIRFFMGRGAAVWNNRGDTATLYDDAGRVVTTYVY